jgi:hypothetical protein
MFRRDMKGDSMMKTVLILSMTAILAASAALAETNVNISIGVPGPTVVVPPPPPPPQTRVVVSAPPVGLFVTAPLFVVPSQLGFYVGVDTTYDIFYSSDYYYLYYGNGWHRSRYYNGPWTVVPYKQLPPGIRKHRIERIREYRDHEYRVYRDEQHNYRGRHFRPDKEYKEYRKEEKRYEKEMRKEEKHEHKKHKHDD